MIFEVNTQFYISSNMHFIFDVDSETFDIILNLNQIKEDDIHIKEMNRTLWSL